MYIKQNLSNMNLNNIKTITTKQKSEGKATRELDNCY